MSAPMQGDLRAVSSNAPANQTTFFPINLGDRPAVHNGEIAIRKILAITISVDHFLVDGLDLNQCGATLGKLLENPQALMDADPERRK